MCDHNKTEKNPLMSARIFHKLGKIYRQRSSKKLCLVKSSTLYNAALARKPVNAFEIKRDLNELCSHVTELAGATNLCDNSLQIADVLQSIIQTYRKTIKKQVEDISQINDESQPKSFQDKLVVNVERLQKEIHQFFFRFYETYHEILRKAKIIRMFWSIFDGCQ